MTVFQGANDQTRKDMAALRLVNKCLNRLATPILFKTFDAYFPGENFTSSVDWAARLVQMSQGPVIEFVQVLNLGFARYETCSQLEPYLMEAACVLPALVKACRSLKALRINHSWIETKLLAMSSDHGNSKDLYMKMIEHILRQLSSSPQVHNLELLEMSMPLTHDFAELQRVASTSSPAPYPRPFFAFMKGLKHLLIAVLDKSGSGGERYFFTPESESHQRYPNTIHVGSFLKLASLPERLHTLSIHATHMLDLDLLGSYSLGSLRKLILSRVRVSHQVVADLSCCNNSTLASVEFAFVELKSGTWATIHEHFRNLPQLKRCWIESCGYTEDGASADLARGIWPPVDDSKELESLHGKDYEALANLQRYINHARILAGQPPLRGRLPSRGKVFVSRISGVKTTLLSAFYSMNTFIKETSRGCMLGGMLSPRAGATGAKQALEMICMDDEDRK